jgi:hypothetical protein
MQAANTPAKTRPEAGFLRSTALDGFSLDFGLKKAPVFKPAPEAGFYISAPRRRPTNPEINP